ncbi:MAG: hypothetical protein ACI31S_04880 [Bacilli bacterium]
MKRILLIMLLFLLVGCTNKVEEEKNNYLTYKSNLQEKEEFDNEEELDFNTYFNIQRENAEKINYSLVIEDPKIDMYNIKALLIHDYVVEDVFPTVGIFDDAVTLLSGSNDKITMQGSIQTEEDISSTKFKLYIEYEDKDGLENKVYYEVARG